MWNFLELKNIAWIYSCIITDIRLMYTALDFYLWRGSIWVFILTIMDKTSSQPPQQKLQWWRTICQCRHYWRQNQTEDAGIWWLIGLVCLVVDVTGDEGSWPVLSLGSCMQEHTGAACDRGTKRQTNWWEMDQVTRWLEHKAGHGWPWSCYTLSPPAAGHPAALWLSLLTTRAYTLHPYYRSLLYIIISVSWYHCTYNMNNITQPYLFLKVSLK